MEIAKIGIEPFFALSLGAVLALVLPLGLALWWKKKKDEPFTTILVGAATFLLFALLLEKPLQALVLSEQYALGQFLKATPLLFALVAGLFPGIFEETGRLVAFKTVLRKRQNRETAISHGLGHGCFEAMLVLLPTSIYYIIEAVKINNGTFAALIEKAAQEPEKVADLTKLAQDLANLQVLDIFPGFLERIFAVLFHIGGSLLVFYACKNREKFWLYPLAILIHTLVDFIAGLYMLKVITLPLWTIEVAAAVIGCGTFLGGYILLYRKDQKLSCNGVKIL